jgi:hypothetical protein
MMVILIVLNEKFFDKSHKFLLDILVTGHKSGEILIWRNLSTLLVESETPICTRLHWHAHRGIIQI